jgi:hypothetical protein
MFITGIEEDKPRLDRCAPASNEGRDSLRTGAGSSGIEASDGVLDKARKAGEREAARGDVDRTFVLLNPSIIVSPVKVLTGPISGDACNMFCARYWSLVVPVGIAIELRVLILQMRNISPASKPRLVAPTALITFAYMSSCKVPNFLTKTRELQC